jgi:hypothetical protein
MQTSRDVDSRNPAVMLNQGSAERRQEQKGRNANRTDIKGNRTLELVRKQLEEDGRKTELLGNGQTDKGKWNRKAGGHQIIHGSRLNLLLTGRYSS